MELSRRELLKILGISGGAAGLGCFASSQIFSVPDEVFERLSSGPRFESMRNSLCTFCPGGCGIRVRLIDDVPVRILGNPASPVNRGSVCPMAESAIEALYHPRRIGNPLRRVGHRGSESWEAISIDDALTVLADRLQSLHRQGEANKVALLTRDSNHFLPGLFARFMQAYGSSNFHCVSSARVSALPGLLTQGLEQPPVYDFLNADLILNFGADLLDEPDSPVRYNQIYSELRNRRDRVAAKIIHIAPYLSRTAANSTLWVPIAPGTMAALALSIAHVMLRDGSVDSDFLERHSSGLRPWIDPEGNNHRGVESLILEQYYPESVERITEVPAEQIVEIARAFSSANTAVAIPGSQAVMATNGLYAGFAIHCLNALKGNLGRPGGVLFPRRSTNLPQQLAINGAATKEGSVQGGKAARRSATQLKPIDSVDELVRYVEENRSAVDTLIIQGIDPLYETILYDKCASALRSIPFIVSFSSFLDGSTALADLILPEPTLLERWEGSAGDSALTFEYFGVQRPVVEPLYDTIHPGDFVLSLAKRLGGSIAESCRWEDYLSLLRSHAQDLFTSGKGSVVSEGTDYGWIESLKDRGWQAFDYSNADEFWRLLVENGGWWSPRREFLSGRELFQTGSQKFEFFSQNLSQTLLGIQKDIEWNSDEAESIHRAWNLEARGDLLFMPHQEPLRDSREKNYPLRLLTFQRISNPFGQGRHFRLMGELSGLHSREYWRSWVEISPETANQLGIEEDEWVFVISSKGRLEVRAKLVPSVMAGTVVMPEGLELSESIGRGAGNRMNPREIFVDESDRIVALPSLISTMVRIEKAPRHRKEV